MRPGPAGRYLVGVSVDLGAGSHDQVAVGAVAKFLEGEVDGRGDAVGHDGPDRHPVPLLQADLLGVEGDVGVGSHIKVPRRPDVGVSPGIAGIEAGGVQHGVHRRGQVLGNAEIGFAQPDRARDRREAEQMSGKEPHRCTDRVDAVMTDGRRRSKRGVVIIDPFFIGW